MLLVFGLVPSFAQAPKVHFEAEKSLSEVRSNSIESTRLHIAFEGMNYLDVETREGNFTELFMPGAYHTGALGTPKLPASKNLIEIPFGAEVDVKVLDYTVEEYRLSDLGVQNQVMPVQPAVRKDQDVLDIPFEYQADTYSRSDFISPELAVVEELGVMRSIRLGRLVVSPVHYNPAEEKIRVYNNIEIEIRYEGADMAKSNRIKASTYSPSFEGLYAQVMNPFDWRSEYEDHPDLTKYPVKMVLVSHPDFETALQPFIEWKTKQGIEVIEAYTDDIGGSVSDIQDFIHDQYDQGTPEDPAPTYVTLVGDSDKLPASATGSASGHVTDLYYASVDGDYFPDMYYGRLSARNVQELQNQLDKILYYQQYAFEDPSYLDDVTLIAGADSNWNPNIGQSTVMYGTDNYFNAANGFNNVNAYLDSYAGSYDEERIAVSMINYTAHCSPTSWSDPSLAVNDIHNMTNANQYPVAIGNCCMSSQFSHSESIGEAWVRAEKKGSVAYIGSAPNTYWFDDFYWAVGAFPISGNNNGYVPSTDETSIGVYDAPFVSDYKSVASIKFVGNLAVTEAHMENYSTHSGVQYYWEAYHTFGDPSTSMYLTQGEENNVTHMPTVPIGVDTYNVEAVPGSYVAISKDGILHGAAYVDESGSVDVPIEPITDGGEATIVVTRPQYIPYVVEIPAAALEGPFVVLDEFTIQDPEGTQQANYGETFSIDVTIQNVGDDPVNEVTVTLEGEDEHITLLNAGEEIVFDGMGADEDDNTSDEYDVFSFEVAHDVPDQHRAQFVMTITDGNEEWESNLNITANAPVFSINPDYVVDDGEDGNGHLDPGNQALLVFEVTNHGHGLAREPVFELQANSPYITIEDNIKDLDPIPPNKTKEIYFQVDAHPSTVDGTHVNMELLIEDGHKDHVSTDIVIGQVPEIVLGEGHEESNEYPFYNYYEANRTQMLYKADEIGEGEKDIIEIAFDIISVADDQNDLPNFVIRMKHTDVRELGDAFLDTEAAQEVFEAGIYKMPMETGWHTWELEESFAYDGENNLLVEIVWGQLGGWTFNNYEVACSNTESQSVAYGYSDTQVVPSFEGTSNIRPNLWLAFAAEETAETKTIDFIVQDYQDNLLEDAGIRIGSLTQMTDNAGVTRFTLMPGEYDFTAEKEDYRPHNNSFKMMEDTEILVRLASLDNTYEVTFNVELTHAIALDLLEGFDPEDHYIMISGDFIDWPEPGEGPDEMVMEQTSDDPLIFSKTIEMIAGEHAYKYFSDRLGKGWEGGEWDKGDNRLVKVYKDMQVHDHFGYFDDEVGISDISESEINVYPNPARNHITVVSPNAEMTHIRMVDIMGKEVYNMEPANKHRYKIQTSGLTHGMYFIQVFTSSGIVTHKIQITR